MPLGDSWLGRGTLPGSLFWWRTGLLLPPAAPWGSSGAALFLDEEDIEAAAARKEGTREVAVAVVGLAGKSCSTTSCQPIIRNPQVSPPLSRLLGPKHAPLKAKEADVRNADDMLLLLLC